MDKVAFLIVVFLFSSTAFSQTYYSPYFRVAPASRNSGNSAQLGAGVDVNSTIDGRVIVDADISLVYEPKSYVGNGFSFRSQAELGYKFTDKWFLAGGGSVARHTNSQYTKYQYQPMISAHFNPNKALDLYGTALLPAYGNDNDVKGARIGYRSYLEQPNRNSSLFVQVEFTRFSFKDYYRNTHYANSIVFGVGIGFKK